MTFGKDRSERAGLLLTTRRLVTSARTLVQPFVRCATGSSCFTGLWICLPRGKAAGDEIVDKDAAGDDSDPER